MAGSAEQRLRLIAQVLSLPAERLADAEKLLAKLQAVHSLDCGDSSPLFPLESAWTRVAESGVAAR
jgi:hypothetical protein